MVTRTLSIAAVLALASFAHADDTARKVKVALALSKGRDCQKDKVKSALDAALPKSKERKVAEALMPISTAPMPRECKDGKCASCPCAYCGCDSGKPCYCEIRGTCKCPSCPTLNPPGYDAIYARVLRGERVTFEVKKKVGSWDAGVWECFLENGKPTCRLKPVAPAVPVNPIRVQYPAYPFGNGPICLPGGK